jgi:hypothetical protein
LSSLSPAAFVHTRGRGACSGWRATPGAAFESLDGAVDAPLELLPRELGAPSLHQVWPGRLRLDATDRSAHRVVETHAVGQLRSAHRPPAATSPGRNPARGQRERSSTRIPGRASSTPCSQKPRLSHSPDPPSRRIVTNRTSATAPKAPSPGRELYGFVIGKCDCMSYGPSIPLPQRMG